MNIFMVTVTYGNRFNLLKQVIDASLSEGVKKVIVVDNASQEESRKQLQEYERANDKIKVIYLDENLGSAGGYKRGIEEAYNDKECEFIWLLDDDNVPQKGALNSLVKFWQKNSFNPEEVALLSYREVCHPDYRDAIYENDSSIILGKKNSFDGFHIIDLPKKVKKLLRYIFRIKENSHSGGNSKKLTGVVSIGYYGGLFFQKRLINKIGLPNEEYFTYADDTEWTYRLTLSGGKIFLLLDSVVEDIEISWNLAKQGTFSILSIANGTPFRLYYTMRNRAYFEQRFLVTNRFVYKLNQYTYLFLMFLLNPQTYKVAKLAIKDAENNHLGRREFINMG